MIGAVAMFESAHVKPMPGQTLVVGSHVYPGREDRRERYERSIGADIVDGAGVDLVLDLEEPLPSGLAGTFAHVDCISVLEHSRRPWLLAANIERLLVKAGTLFVTAPFVWRIHSYPDDFWRFSLAGLELLFPGIQWTASAYAHSGLSGRGGKIPARKIDDYLYIARTESCMFGYNK